MNPREDSNNVQVEVNDNFNNSYFDVSQNRENNGINLENPISETATHKN